jgi:hypothetical protein
MDLKEIKEINKMHISPTARALITHIESIIPMIPSDIVRQLVSLHLSKALEKADESLLRQILLLAVTSIESSKLIEHKIKTKDLKYNIFTNEILSEINCMPAYEAVEQTLQQAAVEKKVKVKTKARNEHRSESE